MRRLLILGSTGSIGQNVIDIVRENKDLFSIVGLSAKNNVKILMEQIEEFSPKFVAIENEEYGKIIKDKFQDILVIYGKYSSSQLVEMVEDIDMVINAIIGFDGFLPTIKALERGIQLALANKESLVVGGEFIRKHFFHNKRDIYSEYRIIPIDSEHNAIFSILCSMKRNGIKKIFLPASGGPFLNYNDNELSHITPEKALQHPIWKMGRKITIDSATLMNKGFEVIEAHYLFGTSYDDIKVIIHPNGLIHGMVLFQNGELILNAYKPDMRLPIANAIFFPSRVDKLTTDFNLFSLGGLDIRKVNYDKFRALRLCYEVGKIGGCHLVALNAANEEAVNGFLEKKISFLDIVAVINEVLESMNCYNFKNTIEEIMTFDKISRKKAKEVIKRIQCKI